jgi:FtsZ-binding cell division protein ZapB
MSNEQPHDPTITLRLELGRVTDQRDAYQSALRKEVLAVIKDALSDNTRIIAENNRMTDTIGCMGVEVDDLRKENALLNERIDNLVIKNNRRHAELELLDAKNRNLQAEVNRLTDAITSGQAITPDARVVP